MIVITGPSASGKTATCRYLERYYGIRKVITHTTRPMRVREVNDVDYHFVSDEKFNEMIKNNEFVEHAIYHGHQYGTSKKEVGIDKCLAVELNGAKTYKSFDDPRIVLFFMQLDENTCRERMTKRGDDPVKIEERITNDREAFQLSDEMKKMVDCYVDTKKLDLPHAADFIYHKYIEILKERGISFDKPIIK